MDHVSIELLTYLAVVACHVKELNTCFCTSCCPQFNSVGWLYNV